jgi:(R,R)-butanediol dehydrogenase/meso-butanediol dehydrogenase/diacetyl reductase
MAEEAQVNSPEPGAKARYRFPRIQIENALLGEVPANSARIKLKYAGICGTDVHLLESDPVTGQMNSSVPAQIPAGGRVLGHEGCGQVVAVGSNVSHVGVGDFVSFESIYSCKVCTQCRRGKFNQCMNSRLMGTQFDGVFSDLADVENSMLVNVSELSHSEQLLRSAACLEPAGVAFLACQNAGLSSSDRLVILGAGPIGYFSAMIGRVLFGVQRIAVVEPEQFRRTHVRGWVDEVFSIEEYLDSSDDFDAAIETSGDMRMLARTVGRIGPNGRLALLARSGQPLIFDFMDHLITNNITLVGSRGHLGGILETLIPFVRDGRLPLGEAVTEIVSGIDGLFDRLSKSGSLKGEQCKVLCGF